MSRPVIFDATSLLSGQANAVDRMLAANLTPPSGAVVAGRRGIAPVPFARIEKALNGADLATVPRDGEDDPVLRATLSWLLGVEDAVPSPQAKQDRPPRGFLDTARFTHRSTVPGVTPSGNIFVKVGLRGWSDPGLGRWLDSRPDLVPVAILDDLWTLDHPEYLPGETATTMRRCFDRLARSARALILPTEVARQRVEAVLGEPGRHGITLHVVPPPSELAGTEEPPFSVPLAKVPFIVVAGPLDARSNLPLLLTLLRERVIAGQPVPKLVLAGRRGAQVEEIRPLLDWNENLRPHLRQADGLRPQGLRVLLAHARALLAPDFAAGSGALVRDAQAIGTRVIASDIPPFREVPSPKAHRLHPLDGPGWSRAVGALLSAGPRSPTREASLLDWPAYRAALQAIVASL